jgi:hypothetical protein
MAIEKFKAAKESELSSLVESAIKTSVGYYDSKLSNERKEVIDYYHGTKPNQFHSGSSKYISMDVYDAVESMKAVLLETFAAGNQIVRFAPQGEDDVQLAQVATDYCDYVVFRQNSGYQLFSTVITDGLLARVGIAKVYWEKNIEMVEEEFSSLTDDELDAIYASDDFEDVDADRDEDTFLWSGTVSRKVNRSQVRIDPVPPEEFLVTPQATSLQDAQFVAHRTRKTLSELIKEGYDKKLVDSISAGDNSELTMDPEVLARFEEIGADRLNLNGELQAQTREVIVYECYVYIDMEGDGIAKLYKVTKAGSVILDYERVDRKPFVHFTPLPIPHSFYGSNYAYKVIPTQNARTALVRGIIDHTMITNNPRMMVVKGALSNPKELIENRLGGIVNVSRPDGLAPLPQSSLNPFVFQTVQLLDEDKEEATGVSKLSQGLNKDAVSKQNSQAMVENLVSLSMQREKILARNFAYQFLTQLYLEVYRLVTANEREEKVLQIAGNFTRMYPSTWDERSDVMVEMKLGYGESEAEANKFLAYHQMMSQDPQMAPMYQAQNKYNVIRTILDKSGIKNTNDFITPPDQIPPPQPDPMAMKQMELQERQVASQEASVQAQVMKVQTTAEMQAMKVELDRMKFELERFKSERDLERKEFDSTSRAAIAAEEVQMAKTISGDNKKAIISPNA